MDPLYTTHDISRLLQVDPSTVSKWIDRGILLAFRTPGGHRRVRGPDLRTFLIAHQMPLPDELGSPAVRLLTVDGDRQRRRRIRARKALEGVRLLTMTRRHGPDAVDLSLKAGAVACFAKPVEVEAVVELFRVPLAMGAKAAS